jgi:hypothetical protein
MTNLPQICLGPPQHSSVVTSDHHSGVSKPGQAYTSVPPVIVGAADLQFHARCSLDSNEGGFVLSIPMKVGLWFDQDLRIGIDVVPDLPVTAQS